MEHLGEYRLYARNKQQHIVEAMTLHLAGDDETIKAARERAQRCEG